MVDAVITYFAADPLKLLYVLGGTGGLWFWVEKWLDRRRLRVRLLAHSFDIVPAGLRVTVQFEVENIGKSPTSLEPFVQCVGYSPERKRKTATLAITDNDRLLPPHATRRMTVEGTTDETYPWWLFKSFRLCPTRGSDRIAYSRNAPIKSIGWFRYDLELTLFRWFGWLSTRRRTQNDG